MKPQHTPGPWSVDEDPLGGDYMTYVVLPSPSGMFGTPIAHCQHNWNDAAVGERRISWKEAEANARLSAASPELLDLAYQYLSDLRRPPTGDSLQRRIERAEKLIAKATGAA